MLQLHMKSIQKCLTHLHASTLLHFLHALAREMASEGTEMAPGGTEMDPVGTEMDPWEVLRDRKSTRLNSSHSQQSRMPSSA